MEDKNQDIKCRPALQAYLIQQTLASWRFFLLFSAPPFMWGLFIAQMSLPGIFIVFLCGIVWFGCWRLWLDERYFRFISEENNEIAGEVLHFIWCREKLQQRTFADRQRGTLNLFRHTMRLTGMLWVVWLMVGLWVM
ncbi:hypothetical protein [Pectobacterium parmentieri]|uniref:Uncharacterized protein n=1 Tax=Pectobacterium parmentieri TaxID=1905730 RepID=A0A8B3FDE5_PECPM|nr:hypothetical protein [Pectobacterium parmentieri]AOR58617.1 hypothetical protein A8F97_06820 [Pectobacterium parmentieri]AYH10383.1 hypothetical protein C5E24_12130 [Pectobacterium parmentieri]AYH18906.1 hypothetical protein C5E22_10660 [Pectobacterium parmentieri]AYH36664.1 hypothetical protein C5E17_11875 [Pectobacterium parmentieri]AZS56896.1 hypothetical protein C5E18_12565 [Pectobacterium parmentieri]